MVTQRDLQIYEGDSDSLILTLGDGTLDITNYIVTFTVKLKLSDSDANALMQKIITTHTSPLTGVTTIPILPVDTKDKAPTDYFYDIRYDEGNGVIRTVMKGKFTIIQATGDL